MKRLATIAIALLSGNALILAQVDSGGGQPNKADTSFLQMNLDATYNRPFLQFGKVPVALGGYVEANSNYESTDGISEGLSFQMRRLTIFMSSSISRRISFLSEIEFEDGAKEINIEFAAIDFELHPLLNLRGGMIMNPIGAFNQNHDGPKWEFIDRPIAATRLLPATWSNVGFGLFGKRYHNDWVFAYEVYLTNGFNERIIANENNKTFLPAAKLEVERFEESWSGVPMTTTKVAVRHRHAGEIGISYMGGVFNKFRDDGLVFDERRRVDVGALDFNTHLPTDTYINGEWCWIWVDVPASYTQQFGDSQQGGFIDFVQPVKHGTMLGFQDAVLNAVLRLEYADWNVGAFRETGGKIFDETTAVVPGISWRPSSQTVVRFNYRYQWTRDLLGNPASRTGAVQFGLASYF